MVIRAGRNIYPQELEEALNDVPGLRRGCSAVFGSADPSNGTERLVVLCETRETAPDKVEALRSRVTDIVIDLLGMPADDIVLAPPGSVLKTSSGKLRRGASRERYEQGLLGRPPRAVWWQLARLAAGSLLSRFRRLARSAGDLLYAGYFWVPGRVCACSWSGISWWLPRSCRGVTLWRERRPASCVGCCCFLSACRARRLLRVRGRASLLRITPATWTGSCWCRPFRPPRATWSKGSSPNQFFARVLLRRLGVEFVERFRRAPRRRGCGPPCASGSSGAICGLFPGRFGLTRAPGLRPFRMGAFAAAARAGVPVVPVGIRGTRTVLRSDQWLPRRAPIRVLVGEAVYPAGNDLAAAANLRAFAREAGAPVVRRARRAGLTKRKGDCTLCNPPFNQRGRRDSNSRPPA